MIELLKEYLISRHLFHLNKQFKTQKVQMAEEKVYVYLFIFTNSLVVKNKTKQKLIQS